MRRWRYAESMRLILASGSPRRREILEKAGYDFEVIYSDAEETAGIENGIEAMCEENARLKADAVFRDHLNAVVVGSDTLVYLDGQPLGKPCDISHAVEMLEKLSGRTNTVCSSVAVLFPDGVKTFSELVEVKFKVFGRDTIDAYMAKVDVMDKAGAFAAQEHADMIIEEIRGEIETVMGLPIVMLDGVFAEIGLRPVR